MKKRCLVILLQVLFWIAAEAFCAPGGTEEPPGGSAVARYAEFNQSVETALESEREALRELREDLDRTRKRQSSVENELNAYRIQHSTHGTLLLLPGTGVDTLERALKGTRDSLVATEKRIRDVFDRLKQLRALQAQAVENFKLNEKYRSNIVSESPADPEATKLSGNIESILGTFTEKQKVLIEHISLLENEKRDRQEINRELDTLREKLELQIKNRRKQERFLRTESLISSFRSDQFTRELGILGEKLAGAGTLKFWIAETGSVFQDGKGLWPAFCIALLLVTVVLVRLRRLCLGFEGHKAFSGYPLGNLALCVFTRSIPLLGITLFIHWGAAFGRLSALPLVRMVLTLLWTFLLTRWGKDLFLLPERLGLLAREPFRELSAWTLFAGIRGFSLVYAPLVWLVGGGGLSLLILRILFEAGLVVWAVLFIGRVLGPFFETTASAFPGLKFLTASVSRLIAMVVIVGPLAEAGGYGAFVMYWYMSWGRTLVTIMWGVLLFMVLREWRKGKGTVAPEAAEEEEGGDRLLRWMLVQAGWAAWLSALVFTLFLSWGASHELLATGFRVLKHRFILGNMSFSLVGCFYALFTLFVTHLAGRAWRQILRMRFLQGSGLEPGLQESIVSITVYFIWGAGIFIALHLFGLNTASLAVALGALGIGIGLGLQNIVNNFVSGLILLFERPIQVGDDVEVGGIWATVKKIKVRSTVVQTYDNASLIIPNSEFISNQVTNWSFRDKSLRRKIVVGVAYGSDIRLVKETLLEIADRTPGVLRYPHPDVLFSDFGDSALIFTLRIWTTIDNMLLVETDVRFEIDRLFRERKISIAFPQRDVHLFRMDERPGDGES